MTLFDLSLWLKYIYDNGYRMGYEIGKQDALKSFPKWKKVDSNPAKFQYNLQGTRLYLLGEGRKVSKKHTL